jgi:hypothetical protein
MSEQHAWAQKLGWMDTEGASFLIADEDPDIGLARISVNDEAVFLDDVDARALVAWLQERLGDV